MPKPCMNIVIIYSMDVLLARFNKADAVSKSCLSITKVSNMHYMLLWELREVLSEILCKRHATVGLRTTRKGQEKDSILG